MKMALSKTTQALLMFLALLLVPIVEAFQGCGRTLPTTTIAQPRCSPVVVTGRSWSQESMATSTAVFNQQPSENDNTAEEQKRRSEAIGGTGVEGKTLLFLGFFLSAWFFTVPTEFRHARICDERETAANPEVCTTPGMFGSKVVDYYKGGGGIKWDFTVADETKAFFEDRP
jgi:hypothetical protein